MLLFRTSLCWLLEPVFAAATSVILLEHAAVTCPAPPACPATLNLPCPAPASPALPALPCPALPCPALSCPALPCPVLPSQPALPHLTCPVLPRQPCPACPALPCPALPDLSYLPCSIMPCSHVGDTNQAPPVTVLTSITFRLMHHSLQGCGCASTLGACHLQPQHTLSHAVSFFGLLMNLCQLRCMHVQER